MAWRRWVDPPPPDPFKRLELLQVSVGGCWRSILGEPVADFSPAVLNDLAVRLLA